MNQSVDPLALGLTFTRLMAMEKLRITEEEYVRLSGAVCVESDCPDEALHTHLDHLWFGKENKGR